MLSNGLSDVLSNGLSNGLSDVLSDVLSNGLSDVLSNGLSNGLSDIFHASDTRTLYFAWNRTQSCPPD